MKIAIVRGNNLNPFEMQSFRTIASKQNLTGYASYMNHFELNGIHFPIKKLHTVEEYYSFLPGPVKGLAYGMTLPWGWNAHMFGLEKELEDKDIIHAAETYSGYSYQAARVRKEQKKKLVLTVWENIPFLSTKRFMGWDKLPSVPRRFCERLTNNDHIVRYVKENTDIFIAVTDRAKYALIAEGVPEERIRVIPAGVDTDRFGPAKCDPEVRRMFNVDESDFVVLCIGRLEREKGIYDLLYAARLLSAEPGVGHVKVVIVGSGPEKENIIRTIKKLGIDNSVRIVGGFPYAYVPKLYNAADAFILPSIPMPWWQEQFGMVLVEAMASGVPIITTMSGSIPEVVGDSAILVQPNDFFSIYNAIKSLVLDRSLRNDLSNRSRKRAMEQFNIETISGKVEALYKELA